MVEELSSVDEDVGGARRRDVAQHDAGVAPSVRVPRLHRLSANGASLGGVGEAADTRDALAGARAEEDELRLPRALLLRLRGGDRATAAGGNAAGGGEGARGCSTEAEVREGEAGRGGRRGAREREARAQGADRGERARRERRMQHGQAVRTQERGDRAGAGRP